MRKSVPNHFISAFLKLVNISPETFARAHQPRRITIGSDWMIGPLGKVASSFRLTTRKKDGDCTTSMMSCCETLVQYKSKPLRHAIFDTTSSILTSGPDLGAWPDCWISVEFLHAPDSIPRKGSRTITSEHHHHQG